MTTKLEKALRRELKIGNDLWVVTIDPKILKLTLKGRRKGIELAWKDIVSGEAALAAALNASQRPARRRVREEEPEKSPPRRGTTLRALR